MKNTPLILVDGSSYLFRAYHALPPLTNSKGLPTGAIYGVLNMLKRLLNEYDPTYLAVIFDPKGGSFRHQLYAEYKANRKEMPEDLGMQIQPLFEIIRAMGLPLIVVDGVEADDVIGTLSEMATRQKRDVIISTGDKDMAQLVNQHVQLVNTMSDTKLNIEGVKEKFGVTPEQIIDYLTLMGDTSDNVPGVPGVGPKTAVKWLNEYGSLDNLVQHAEEIKGKVGDNFRDFIPKIPLTRQLLTIKCDVHILQQPDDLVPQLPDNEKLKNLFEQYEFKNWLRELTAQAPDQPVITNQLPTKTDNILDLNKVILTEEQFSNLLRNIEKHRFFSFDTETTGLDYMEAELVGMSFAFTETDGVYLPVAHSYLGVPAQLNRDEVLKKLKPILESHEIKKLGQNLKYDKEILANYDIELNGIKFDTMLESYIFNSVATRHNMDALALKYLHHQTTSFEDIAGKGAKQITFDQISLDQAAPYAIQDAEIVIKLHHFFWPKIQKDEKLLTVFQTVEMPLLNVLAKTERSGVLVDTKLLAIQSKELSEKIKKLEEKAYQLAGMMFNLSSPKQLQEILFDKLKLPALKKTPGGQPSTAEDVLQDLAFEYPLPKVILEYRSLTKLKSTYVDALPLQISAKTGRVHTSFHQAVTSTGRLSSSDPNLQNIPVRTEEGRRIRQAFIAPKGYKIISADYSQIELRIMAHLSQDPGLLRAFSYNQDVHTSTASQVFGVPLELVTSDQRRKAKAINFGLIYGMSAFGLAKQIGVERQEAQQYVDEYFRQYPGVKAYMENTRAFAHQHGFVETILGRKLYLPDINSRTMMIQKASERMAINAPMQGTAADIIKLAMIKVDEWISTHHINVKMIMQVHDELVFEVAEPEASHAMHHIQELMQNALELHVPLIVAVGCGDNWDEAH